MQCCSEYTSIVTDKFPLWNILMCRMLLSALFCHKTQQNCNQSSTLRLLWPPRQISALLWLKNKTTATHLIVILSLLLFPDFAEPLMLPSMIDPGPSTSDSPMGATPLANSPPEESIAILTSMGFPRTHSIQALKATVSLLPTLFMFALLILTNNSFSH